MLKLKLSSKTYAPNDWEILNACHALGSIKKRVASYHDTIHRDERVKKSGSYLCSAGRDVMCVLSRIGETYLPNVVLFQTSRNNCELKNQGKVLHSVT